MSGARLREVGVERATSAGLSWCGVRETLCVADALAMGALTQVDIVGHSTGGHSCWQSCSPQSL